MINNLPALPMYTAIHHDRLNNLIFVWYADGTKQGYRVKHRSYTPISGQYGAKPCGMVDIFGKELYEIIVDSKEEMNIRSHNMTKTNEIAECDIDFRTRWLENHYNGQGDIPVKVSGVNICFFDIEVASTGKWSPSEEAEFPVNCVTIYFSKTKQYYAFGLNRDISPKLEQKLKEHKCEYINCPTERELITKLFTTIGNNNADILASWNGDYYDCPYLVNRANKVSANIKLISRLPEQYKTAYMTKREPSTLVIGGTANIDFLRLYRKFTINEQDNFKLDTIGKLETGESKAPLPDKYKSWIKYWDDWVWYNFKDVELMVKIEETCKMFDTTIHACLEARVPFESIFETKKMEVGFILNYLHSEGIAMPPLKQRERQSFAGAYVYAKVGYYTYLVSYDYGSMYPSFIMGANTSPETKVVLKDGKYYDANWERVTDVVPETLVRSPLKVYKTNADGIEEIDYEVFYRTDKVGIIPRVTEKIFIGRKRHKKTQQEYEREGNFELASIYEMKQKTYKIFGNGLYGLLGNPYFQFYDLDNSGTITAFGVELITYTIKHLCKYFEGEFKVDERFIKAFGAPPNMDTSLEGSFEEVDENGKVDRHYNRLSHGDTDSFFVKYDDIYAPFVSKAGKEVEVTVVRGNEIIHKNRFQLDTEEKKSKIDFNTKCTEFCPSWSELSNEDKAKAFKDGMYREGEYRVFYNRHCLTDFCRVLDAVLMEDVLANIMQKFADKYNFMKNTLTLKREKCITQAIVTAKKKYICNVESNEDIKIYDPDKRFKVTGLEIVRSSTTPFTRKFVLNCVKELLNTMDKPHIRDEYLKIKTEFFAMAEEGRIYDLAIPSGIKTNPPEYNDILDMEIEDKKKLDWRVRAGAAWNYLIKYDDILKNEMHEPIYGGSKAKFLKLAHNSFGLNSIAFIGDECPKQILERFNVDWDAQWETGFSNVMNRLFNAVGWGEVEYDERDSMMEVF